MTEPTAADAMAHAEAAHIKVEAHEDLCAERYGHIQTLIGNVESQVKVILKVIGWGGALFATLLLTLLGFFASRALSTNDAKVNELQAQIAVLTAQQHKP